jgi:replicative DNA helicase
MALYGLQPGQLIVLLAETMRGKTSFALQLAARAAMQTVSPLIWALEMSAYSMFRRLVAQLSGVPSNSAPSQLTFQERDAHREACVMLNDCPIWFDTGSRSVSSFVAALRKLGRQSKLGFAVVDYLQLIRSGEGRNRAEEVSDNSRALKLAAMDLQIPIFVISQVDRASVKGDGEIGLHSAKNSGDIENDADVLLWIKGQEFTRDSPTDVRLHVGKQREGPAGFDIAMTFFPNTQTFQEIEE